MHERTYLVLGTWCFNNALPPPAIAALPDFILQRTRRPAAPATAAHSASTCTQSRLWCFKGTRHLAATNNGGPTQLCPTRDCGHSASSGNNALPRPAMAAPPVSVREIKVIPLPIWRLLPHNISEHNLPHDLPIP